MRFVKTESLDLHLTYDLYRKEHANQPVTPLSGLPFDKWWWHGYLDFPPKDPNSVMNLPAGKTITVQLADNSDFTSLGPHPEAFWPGGKFGFSGLQEIS